MFYIFLNNHPKTWDWKNYLTIKLCMTVWKLQTSKNHQNYFHFLFHISTNLPRIKLLIFKRWVWYGFRRVKGGILCVPLIWHGPWNVLNIPSPLTIQVCKLSYHIWSIYGVFIRNILGIHTHIQTHTQTHTHTPTHTYIFGAIKIQVCADCWLVPKKSTFFPSFLDKHGHK